MLLRQCLAETINGLYKAEVIHQRGSSPTVEAVEFATLGLAENQSMSISLRKQSHKPDRRNSACKQMAKREQGFGSVGSGTTATMVDNREASDR